jgi:nicotinate phosphoribosyltransferase
MTDQRSRPADSGRGAFPGALVTDLYELNMARSYLRHGMYGPATFSLFVRRLPPTRGFLVAAGLEDCLRFLEGFSFRAPDLDYLGSIGFQPDVLETLRGMRFTGDVWAVPEGRIVLADEPLLEVTAPIAEAQLVETYLLNQVTYQTALASKAARCILAARGKVSLVDFSLRRTHGVEAGLAAARTSALVGFDATSNVEAARRFGLRPAGTMAHSYVQAFPTEREAFVAFAAEHPDSTTFLVDTYDTLSGVRTAIEVIRDLGLTKGIGVRLDSGDLVALARESRRLLDEAGLPNVRVMASGGLDEHDVEAVVEARAPIDALGIGTKMGVSADAPSLDSAYKLVAYDGRPVRKLSPGKATLPGAKQVWRPDGGGTDVIALREEPGLAGYGPLLRPVMRGGSRVGDSAWTLEEGRAAFRGDLDRLPASALGIRSPAAPAARLSTELSVLAGRLEQQLRT